jgi:hypothetical protein
MIAQRDGNAISDQEVRTMVERTSSLPPHPAANVRVR